MQPALNLLGAQPRGFPAPPYLSADAKRVTYRNGRTELDNGRCRDISMLVYFTGRGAEHDRELQAERGRRAERRRLARRAARVGSPRCR